MWVIMLVCWVPLSAVDPQALGSRSFPPPQISQTWLSVCLWLTVGTVAAFSLEQTSHTRMPWPADSPAQISWPSFLLCMEGPGLEQRLRGWNGDRWERKREGENEGANLNWYFLSLLPLLCPIWGERRDTKCRQILKVAADYFRRRKYCLLLWGLHLIRLSAAGVKEGTQVLLFEKIQTSYVFIWPPSLCQTPLEQSSSTVISSSPVSMYHVPLTSTVLQFSTAALLQLWMHQISLMFKLECTQQPWPDQQAAARLQPFFLQRLLMSRAAAAKNFCALPKKKSWHDNKVALKAKARLQDYRETERAQQDDGKLSLTFQTCVSMEGLRPPGLSRSPWLIGFARIAQP